MKQQTGKQKFCEEVEKRVLELLPSLRGKFTALGIWDSINYAYIANGNATVEDTAQRIVKRYAN